MSVQNPISELSHADRCRAGTLKWQGKPPGIPPELAVELMAKLKAGSTVRKLTGGGVLGPAIVSYARFKTHCEMHPDWAAEARRISKVNGDAGKGARLAKRTHCANGHAFAEHGRECHTNGWNIRQCRACEKIRYDRGGILKQDVIEKVRAALENGLTIRDLTGTGPTRLIKHNTFARCRRENPDFDRLVLETAPDNRKRAMQLSVKRRASHRRSQAAREERNDYHAIMGMLPPNFPDKGDVVARIFEDLLTGALKREDIGTRLKAYIAEHNRLYPVKYAKFGNSPLVSLDEVLFDDGTATRGDNVIRGLWD